MDEEEREQELIFAGTLFPDEEEMFVPIYAGRFCSKGICYSLMLCAKRSDVNEDE